MSLAAPPLHRLSHACAPVTVSLALPRPMLGQALELVQELVLELAPRLLAPLLVMLLRLPELLLQLPPRQCPPPTTTSCCVAHHLWRLDCFHMASHTQPPRGCFCLLECLHGHTHSTRSYVAFVCLSAFTWPHTPNHPTEAAYVCLSVYMAQLCFEMSVSVSMSLC